ncbi:MAG TPA: nucleotide pyrophosphohydrolase [Acidimicrobiales bacterium]|nr:nucleotide pyrophosphohydrolase [Acidimicrobiales bacterium]
MDLTELTAALRTFAEERDWEKFHTPRNLAVSVSIEAAELLELVQWRTDEELDADLATESGRALFGDELADVLIYLVRLADVAGIDLAEATTAKIGVNRNRFPLAEPPFYPARP